MLPVFDRQLIHRRHLQHLHHHLHYHHLAVVEAEVVAVVVVDSNLVDCILVDCILADYILVDYMDRSQDNLVEVEVEVVVVVVVEDNSHRLLPNIKYVYGKDTHRIERKKTTCKSIEACSLGFPVPAEHSYRPASL